MTYCVQLRQSSTVSLSIDGATVGRPKIDGGCTYNVFVPGSKVNWKAYLMDLSERQAKRFPVVQRVMKLCYRKVRSGWVSVDGAENLSIETGHPSWLFCTITSRSISKHCLLSLKFGNGYMVAI